MFSMRRLDQRSVLFDSKQFRTALPSHTKNVDTDRSLAPTIIDGLKISISSAMPDFAHIASRFPRHVSSRRNRSDRYSLHIRSYPDPSLPSKKSRHGHRFSFFLKHELSNSYLLGCLEWPG